MTGRLSNLKSVHSPLSWAIVALTCLLAAGSSSVVAQQTPMTLRVNDSIGAPGGVVAIVASTSSLGSSSQPVRRGQADFFTTPFLQNGLPFSDYLGSRVFSDAGDAMFGMAPGNSGFALSFASDSVTINVTDGPLAVIYFQLRDDLVPGDSMSVSIDLADSILLNELGDPIPISIQPGLLKIRRPSDPFEIEVIAEDTVPGESMFFSLRSAEPFRVSSGQAAFRVDPSIVGGLPLVQMDPRYGDGNFTVDSSQPGLVVVTFDSPDASLNTVPGDLITVALPSRSDVPPGTETVISLDPDLTFFLDSAGENVSVQLIDGQFHLDF